MDINYNNSEPPKKINKNKIRLAILIFIILTFVVNSLILADAIHTKYVTYKTLGSLTSSEETDKKANLQGNLGNFNIVSKKNSLIDNKNKTYILTLELEFTNYGETGRSFDEAVRVTAYQNDKEIKESVVDLETAVGERDIKVRNGQTAKIILSYLLKDVSNDVNIDMTAGNDTFTYTVKLTEPKSQQKEAEKKDEKETTTVKKD